MRAPTKRCWDDLLAQHFGVKLAAKTILARQIPELPETGNSLLFTFKSDQCLWVDKVNYQTHRGGMRLKPPRFLLSPAVRKRLYEHRYQWWYWLTDTHLYPLQSMKVDDLMNDFHTVDVPYAVEKTLVISDYRDDLLLR